MRVAWGSRLSSETKGLDVVGIRSIDQRIEASLTNGITTISARARNISILVWALGQFFRDESANGRVVHDRAKLAVYLNRVRFLVLAATWVDPSASRAGASGANKFDTELKTLLADGVVAMPASGSLALLGVYFGPASALGLVKAMPASSGLPFALTERGTRMFEERSRELEGAGVVELLRDAEYLDYETAFLAIPSFSLSRIGEFGSEAGLLNAALEEAWEPKLSLAAKRVAVAYERFSRTRLWIEAELAEKPGSANELIARNYQRCVDHGSSGVARDWASFEWHRRAHFSLEVLLAALTDTLLNSDAGLSVDEMVTLWAQAPNPDDRLSKCWHLPVSAATELIEPQKFAGGLIETKQFEALEYYRKPLWAFELLAVQAIHARSIGIDFEQAATDLSPAARALQLIDSAEGTLADLLSSICQECVAQQHIANTMRKMGNNQDCSLRFYPEGEILVPTRLAFGAGYSGSRLHNTMRILADLGLLKQHVNGVFAALQDSR